MRRTWGRRWVRDWWQGRQRAHWTTGKTAFYWRPKNPRARILSYGPFFPPYHRHRNRSRVFIGFLFRLAADIHNHYAVTYHLAMPDIIEMKSDGIPVINHVISIVFPFFSAIFIFIFLYAHAHPAPFLSVTAIVSVGRVAHPIFLLWPQDPCVISFKFPPRVSLFLSLSLYIYIIYVCVPFNLQLIYVRTHTHTHARA